MYETSGFIQKYYLLNCLKSLFIMWFISCYYISCLSCSVARIVGRFQATESHK